MAYRESVEFLADANPTLIDRSAAEFRRLHKLIESTDDAFRKGAKVEWISEARDRYVKRLTEARDLAEALSEAFRKVAKALSTYADAVTTAKGYYKSGQHTEGKLTEVMSREASAITPTARAAEPLRQWEDLRDTSGFMDFFAELTVDVDAIREEAERYYNQTKDHYGDAIRVETEARVACLKDIKAAYLSLPDFRGTIPDPAQFLKHLGGTFRAEARQAGDDPYVQLPGSGTKVDSIPRIGKDIYISEALYRIQTKVDGLPDAKGINYLLPSNSDERRRDYISANEALIRRAAQDSGLPPEMVAGIAWQEVEGDPAVQDDIAFEIRQVVPGTDDPDKTSMGPLSIQIRRAAEVLGYDPNNLSDAQRQVVVDAVKDPGQNVFIASEYLAQLKAESEFADVPPGEMTRAQMQELAARYNGGPYYESAPAQDYGRGFDHKLDDAKEALG
jgi:hypothetical protein